MSYEANNHTVLIIGGSGCVGQEATKWLLKNRSAKIICLSRGLAAINKDPQVIYEQGDILKINSIEAVLQKHQVTHVLHTAALRTTACKENPALAVEVNINGTVNVLEAMRRFGKVKRLVFISTAAVYQVPGNDVYPNEKHPTSPLNSYTATKLACEQLIECYAINYAIPATILRPQVIYGPTRGEEGSTAGVTTAIKEAAAGRKFTIPFSGQTCFVYSEDMGQYCG
ncbi:MAG: SDR family oxidoreductase, partial [Lentisphaeraceae bacterium]|nr:SDR family oxidoreductase [Lentisphaeraceae bacterium]